MHFTAKYFLFSLSFIAVVSAGCSSASKNQAAASAPAASGKPAVTETPATVTVHGADKKAAKTPKAEKHVKTEGDGGSSMTAECLATGDERKLAIKSTPSGGCEVLYTKGGKTSSITSAQHETKKCQETFDKVKGNLEKAGFKCQ